jgi:hypothetical protein
MSHPRLLACVVVLGLTLVGCGPSGPAPTLDAMTDATAEASLKTMTAGMTDLESKRLREDCDLVAQVSQFDTASAQGDGPKGKLSPLHGLTAAEIRARVASLRAKLSR